MTERRFAFASEEWLNNFLTKLNQTLFKKNTKSRAVKDSEGKLV